MRAAGAPGGVLHDALVLPHGVPNVAPGEMADLVARVLDVGRQMTELALEPTALAALASISVFLAYAWVVGNEPSLRQSFIPANAGDGSDGSPDPDESKLCPLEAPRGKDAPACDSCDGTAEHRVCKKGEWTHCECLLRAKYAVQPADFRWLNIQQWFLEEAADQAGTETQTGEGKIERSDEQANIEKDFFTALAENACVVKELDDGSFEETKTSENVPGDARGGYAGSEIKFRWEKDDNAGNCGDLECTSVFSDLQRGCSFNSHTMSRSGSLTFKCGKASYEYIPKPDEPEPQPEPVEPTFGPMTCHPQKSCGGDVHPNTVTEAAEYLCRRIPGRKLSASDHQMSSIPILTEDLWVNSSPAERTMARDYHHFAYWVGGCDVESERDISVGDCVKNFASTYFNCNNGGNGGTHQIGCAVMGFAPSCHKSEVDISRQAFAALHGN